MGHARAKHNAAHAAWKPINHENQGDCLVVHGHRRPKRKRKVRLQIQCSQNQQRSGQNRTEQTFKIMTVRLSPSLGWPIETGTITPLLWSMKYNHIRLLQKKTHSCCKIYIRLPKNGGGAPGLPQLLFDMSVNHF